MSIFECQLILVQLGVEESSVILLVDDERIFADGRECIIARSVNEAINLTDDVDEIDELWLDYVLAGSDSSDEFLSHLYHRGRNGNPVKLNRVFIHTSSFMAVDLLRGWLDRLGVAEKNVERVEDLSIFRKC